MVDLDKLSLDVQLFFNEMSFDQYQNRHSHQGCILSGICYLKAPQGSANIVFHDPRNHYDFIQLPLNEKVDLSVYSIPPKEGMILIWPAWIKHHVEVNKVDERLVAVFNIIEKEIK